MRVYDIEEWCLDGNGGVVGRTLLLPLSHPQAWEPGPLPPELSELGPVPDRALGAACDVADRLGYAVAIGFALIAERPDEPFAHAFNVGRGKGIDVALAGHEVLGYWAYLPTAEQLAIDSKSLAVEAPSVSQLREAVGG